MVLDCILLGGDCPHSRFLRFLKDTNTINMSSEMVSIGLEDEETSSPKRSPPTAYEKKKLKWVQADGKKKLVKKKKKKEEVDERSIQDASYCDILLLLFCCCKCCYCCGLIQERKKVRVRAVCECSMLTFIFVLMLIFIPLRTYFSIRNISSIKIDIHQMHKYYISIYSHTTSHTQVWKSTP